MAEKTLTEEIITIVESVSNNNPAPQKCTIKKIYNDQKHADVTTDTGEYTYAECIANNLTVGNTGILIFLNGDLNEYIVITK
jgi:hypothetical protein